MYTGIPLEQAEEGLVGPACCNGSRFVEMEPGRLLFQRNHCKQVGNAGSETTSLC